MATGQPHPYYPPGAHLSGGVFTPNTWDVFSLILTFVLGLTAILALTWALVTTANPKLNRSDQCLSLWFVMSKCIG